MRFLTGHIQRQQRDNSEKIRCLSGFIIDGINFNKIRYADVTLLIADTKSREPIKLPTEGSDGKGEGLNIHYKKREGMVVRKRMRPNCKLELPK